MPAFVNSKFGESGMRLEDGTMECCFDLKKSRNDCLICADVIIFERGKSLVKKNCARERKFWLPRAKPVVMFCQLPERKFFENFFLRIFARKRIKESEVSTFFE